VKLVTVPARALGDIDAVMLQMESNGANYALTRGQLDHVITEVVLKADFESRWRVMVALFATIADNGPISVVTRGWAMDEDYSTLAARILAVPATDLAVDALPLHAAGTSDPPGDLTEDVDARLAAEVCRRVPGLTFDNWNAATPARRLGWMRAALESYFAAT
jgi:hypothetical protein